MKRLESIQHLRGIAAILVVFVHFPTELQRFCGAIGVDIFFLISGFIIYLSIEKSAYFNKPGEFLKKRLLRIIPLYYAVNTLFLLMHFLLNLVRHSEMAPRFSVVEIVKSYCFIPISSGGVYRDPIVFLGWSLNFEMYFYLLSFLFLLVFRHRFFYPLLLTLFGLGLAGIVTGGFKEAIPDFLTSSFLFYFCAGMLVGKYRDAISSNLSPLSEILFFASLYILFLVMLGQDYGYPHTGITREQVLYDGKTFPRFFIWGIPALVFFLSYFSLSRKYEISNRWLNELGNRSYSTYLLQVFFIQVFYETEFLFNNSGKVILCFVLMAALVWFSGLSFRYFERRFHR